MSDLVVPPTRIDHALGPADAPVTLVEYADFECPHCAQGEAAVARAREAAGGALRVICRHFPLAEIHPNALLAAEAAEAAGVQGKFWEMHRLLFARQAQLGPRDLLRHAAELELDADLFGAHLVGRVHATRVRADWLNGQRSGVRGTPTFFVNGRRVEGAGDALLEAVRAAVPPAWRR